MLWESPKSHSGFTFVTLVSKFALLIQLIVWVGWHSHSDKGSSERFMRADTIDFSPVEAIACGLLPVQGGSLSLYEWMDTIL